MFCIAPARDENSRTTRTGRPSQAHPHAPSDVLTILCSATGDGDALDWPCDSALYHGEAWTNLCTLFLKVSQYALSFSGPASDV